MSVDSDQYKDSDSSGLCHTSFEFSPLQPPLSSDISCLRALGPTVCGRLNNGPLKYIHALIPGICECHLVWQKGLC